MGESERVVPKLPHAAPFLLLDRVLEVGSKEGAFLKHVTACDPCLGADGVLPPSFVLEALAQAGGALLTVLDDEDCPEPGYLASVDDFRSLEPVRAGDALRVEVRVLRHVGAATLMRGRALVGERVCAEGRFTLALPR